MAKPAPPKQPAKTAQEPSDRGKAERLAAALRDNLKRRKAQHRARVETGRNEPPGED